MPSTNRKETRRSSGATYSSLSSFLKVYHFLRFAASAPEPLVALGDDDVFVQPQMLVAHAALLHEELLSRDGETALAAGAIEWYSWREATLVATGWDRGLKGARIKSQSSWRNCSPKGRGWRKPGAAVGWRCRGCRCRWPWEPCCLHGAHCSFFGARCSRLCSQIRYGWCPRDRFNPCFSRKCLGARCGIFGAV